MASRHQNRLEEIDAHIAELSAERARLRQWPIRSTIALHGDRDSNYETGKRLGLDNAALDTFSYPHPCVDVDVDVYEDGSTIIVGIDGRLCSDNPRRTPMRHAGRHRQGTLDLDDLGRQGERAYPIRTTFYLHSSQEVNYGMGEGLGLSEKALDKFAYTCCEIGIEIDVYENGDTKIVGINGRFFEPQPKEHDA